MALDGHHLFVVSYPEIGTDNFKTALLTFNQQFTFK